MSSNLPRKSIDYLSFSIQTLEPLMGANALKNEDFVIDYTTNFISCIKYSKSYNNVRNENHIHLSLDTEIIKNLNSFFHKHKKIIENVLHITFPESLILDHDDTSKISINDYVLIFVSCYRVYYKICVMHQYTDRYNLKFDNIVFNI